MLTPKTKRNIYRIIPFGIFWLVFGFVYALLERGLLGKLQHYPSTGSPYIFQINILLIPVISLITGLLIGTIEILYLNKIFIRKSFTKKIVYKSFIYLSIIVSFLLFSEGAWKHALSYFSDYAFLSAAIYMGALIVVSQFYTEVSENMGLGVLSNFFTGKYHSPKEESRIFMFLDMRSSTTIAERLGHVKYFEMLREYYSDMSDCIVNYSGEIYQYVGDEIVVSWTLKKGLRNNNCIECFFAIKEAIGKQTDKYKGRFNLLPEFKAGLHVGKVTTGEIGTIKKEIIFTGDVLNTAARIQSLCNGYKADILVSDDLMKELHLDAPFKVNSLGENVLRGRDEKIELYTITR